MTVPLGFPTASVTVTSVVSESGLDSVKLSKHITQGVKRMADRDRHQIGAILNVDSVHIGLWHSSAKPRAREEHSGLEDVFHVTRRDHLLGLQDSRILTTLETDQSLGALLLGVSCRWLLAKGRLLSVQGCLDSNSMEWDLNCSCDQADVGIGGNRLNIAVSVNIISQLVDLNSLLGCFD